MCEPKGKKKEREMRGKKRKREKEVEVAAAEERLMAMGIDVKHLGGGRVGGHLGGKGGGPMEDTHPMIGEAEGSEGGGEGKSVSVCNRTHIDGGTESGFNDVYVQFCGQRASVPSSSVDVATTWNELPGDMEERFKMSMESLLLLPILFVFPDR